MVTRSKEEQLKIQGERLTNARIQAGFRMRSHAINEFGWAQSKYQTHEAGLRTIGAEDAAAYAAAYNVQIEHLLLHDLIADTPAAATGTRVFTIPGYGAASAGNWLEGDDLSTFSDEKPIPAVDGYPVKEQYYRKVVGNSVSNELSNGSFAIIVRLEAFGNHIPHGKLVDVKRERAGLHEHTIKAFYGDKLMTNSAELAVQEELAMNHSDEDTTVTIEGVVIAEFKHL